VAGWLAPKRERRVVRVPEFRGMHVSETFTPALQAGIKLEVVRVTRHPLPVDGVVVAQDPLPGSRVKRDSTVHLIVRHPESQSYVRLRAARLDSASERCARLLRSARLPEGSMLYVVGVTRRSRRGHRELLSRTQRGSQRLYVFPVIAAVTLTASCADGSSPRASAAALKPHAQTLRCEGALVEGSAQLTSELDPGYKVFFGKVALPTGSALGAVPSGQSDPNARLFAKAGLFIKPRAEFELVVPSTWRGRLTIRWGGVPNTTRLRVARCDAPADSPRNSWIGFPGGYSAPNPACVSVVVKSAHRTARAPIGLGMPCRGQSPVREGVPNAT
jgi:hypothetical protein